MEQDVLVPLESFPFSFNSIASHWTSLPSFHPSSYFLSFIHLLTFSLLRAFFNLVLFLTLPHRCRFSQKVGTSLVSFSRPLLSHDVFLFIAFLISSFLSLLPA